MKRILLAVVAVAAMLSASSCAKEAMPAEFVPAEETVVSTSVYAVDLAFDAPSGMESAVVEFYDEFGQAVAVRDVPVSNLQEVIFASGTRPTALYTEGLQNVNEDGVLPIPEQNVDTKAGREPVLLVIR